MKLPENSLGRSESGPRLSVVEVPIDSLEQDPSNARAHDEKNLAAIRSSLARFGQVEPLIVQKGTNRIIAGHGRIVALRALGNTTVSVVELDVNDVNATALGIALNRTAELGSWDDDALAKTLKALEADGFDLGDLAFDEVDLADLGLDGGDDLGEIDDAGEQEPPEQPVTALGDLWILGDHRLLCGDSTSAAEVARLLNGEQPRLMATDPPYLVSYDGTNHPSEHHKKAGRKAPAKAGSDLGNKHWDAYIDPEASVDFFDALLRVALPHLHPQAPIYQWHASRRVSLVEQAWRQNGLLIHQTIVWVKSRAVLTRSHFMWQSEPCLYGWVEGNQPPRDRRPPPSETNVWEIDQAGENDRVHPTQKARAIFAKPMTWHLRKGELAYEPFSGSGTSIIAAEETGRRCYAMELAPPFVDAGLMRWQKTTGREAVLDGDGRTFTEIAAERGVELRP